MIVKRNVEPTNYHLAEAFCCLIYGEDRKELLESVVEEVGRHFTRIWEVQNEDHILECYKTQNIDKTQKMLLIFEDVDWSQLPPKSRLFLQHLNHNISLIMTTPTYEEVPRHLKWWAFNCTLPDDGDEYPRFVQRCCVSI